MAAICTLNAAAAPTNAAAAVNPHRSGHLSAVAMTMSARNVSAMAYPDPGDTCISHENDRNRFFRA